MVDSQRRQPRPVQIQCVHWLAAFTAALLTGCSFIPVYERPAAPVATSYPTLNTPVTVTAVAAAVSLPWPQFFTDVRLQRLITLALGHNRELRVAVLNIEQSRAQFRITRAAQLPAVNGALSGSRMPAATGGISSLYSAGLQVTAFELDFFGRVASLKSQALAQFLATEEGRKTIQISLIAQVANTYLAILADEELLDITRRTLGTREESLKLAKLRFDNGVTSELDYRQAESLLEAAKVAYAQQQRQRLLDDNALTLLVGQPLTTLGPDLLPPSSALMPLTGVAANRVFLAQAEPMADVPAGLPSDLLTSRPDIRQAEQLLLASNANIGAARAAFFPKISLTVQAGSASKHLSDLFQNGSWGWTLAPQLLVPIFDAGRNQAGLDSARVQRDIAVAQYEKAIQIAFREVADALAARATLADQVRASQAQVNAESVRLRLAGLRYDNGVASYLDALDAQRSLFAVQQALVQTRLAQLQSQITLYKVLGGGWTDQPEATAQATAR
jgi:multidrug efflux system outer membrane protein